MNQLAPLLLGARFRGGHGRATVRPIRSTSRRNSAIPIAQCVKARELKGKLRVALFTLTNGRVAVGAFSKRVGRWSGRYEFCWSRMNTSSEAF
jgi:hypothetical protein